jgi:hypothetical protein
MTQQIKKGPIQDPKKIIFLLTPSISLVSEATTISDF